MGSPGTWLRPIVSIGLLIPALLVLPGLVTASGKPDAPTNNARAAQHYTHIQGHLSGEARYGGLLGLPVAGWKQVALSNMAAGLMSMAIDAQQQGDEQKLAELGGLLEEVARRALAVENSPYDVPLDEVEDFNDWGVHLAHVSLTLGCHRYVTGEDTHDRLHRRIVRYQLARMAADGDQHARSYPNSFKWPADQALALAGVHLYDRIHGTSLSVAPISAWLDAIADRSVEGLHPLTLTDNSALPELPDGTRLPPLESAGVPRGSALSPTLFYMAQFAPHEAAALYARYREVGWTHRLGMGGFREWPAGGPGGWDLEGGPVILGLGSLATAQGIAPARLFGDAEAYGAMLRTTETALVPALRGPAQGHLLAPWLVEAWLFNGVTARPWFEPPPDTAIAVSEPPAPIGAWLLLLLDLALIVGVLLPPALRWMRDQPGTTAPNNGGAEPAAEDTA